MVIFQYEQVVSPVIATNLRQYTTGRVTRLITVIVFHFLVVILKLSLEIRENVIFFFQRLSLLSFSVLTQWPSDVALMNNLSWKCAHCSVVFNISFKPFSTLKKEKLQ